MLTRQQQALLEGHFIQNGSRVSSSACAHYARLFGQPITVVTNWFSERREREVKHFRCFFASHENEADLNAILTITAEKEDKMMRCEVEEDGYIPMREEPDEDECVLPNNEDFVNKLLECLNM